MPFVRCKSENRPLGVPAVANSDLAIGQARHLHAVAVGEAQRALNPVRTWPSGTSGRRSCHVTTSLLAENYPQCKLRKVSYKPAYRSYPTFKTSRHHWHPGPLSHQAALRPSECPLYPRCTAHLKPAQTWLGPPAQQRRAGSCRRSQASWRPGSPRSSVQVRPTRITAEIWITRTLE
jgi:hypothetical protein